MDDHADLSDDELYARLQQRGVPAERAQHLVRRRFDTVEDILALEAELQ